MEEAFKVGDRVKLTGKGWRDNLKDRVVKIEGTHRDSGTPWFFDPRTPEAARRLYVHGVGEKCYYGGTLVPPPLLNGWFSEYGATRVGDCLIYNVTREPGDPYQMIRVTSLRDGSATRFSRERMHQYSRPAGAPSYIEKLDAAHAYFHANPVMPGAQAKPGEVWMVRLNGETNALPYLVSKAGTVTTFWGTAQTFGTRNGNIAEARKVKLGEWY